MKKSLSAPVLSETVDRGISVLSRKPLLSDVYSQATFCYSSAAFGLRPVLKTKFVQNFMDIGNVAPLIDHDEDEGVPTFRHKPVCLS